jgi:hypothetical protein
LLQASLSQKIMLPTFYQTHLKKQLTHVQFILLTILLSLIQSEKQVRLERLARVFPPITAESCRRKLLISLDLPQLTIALIWFPLITYWLRSYCPIGQRLSLAIDPMSVGVYQSVHARIDLAVIGLSHYIGVYYPN